MKKMIAKINDNLAYYSRFLTYAYLTLTAVIILFVLVQGDDIAFHMQRLQAISDNIKSGSNFKIYNTTLGDYGYASPLFYGDLFMYPFAFLNALGVDIVLSYKFMCLSILMAIFLSIRFVMYRMCASKDAADIAIFIYIILGCVYGNVVGAAIGRAMACIFVPIAILGLYEILQSPSRFDWVYLAIGVAGTVCFQVIDAVICVIVLFVIFLFHITTLRFIHIRKIIQAIFLFILLSAWFIFPMLEQFADNTFFVTSANIPLGKTSLDNYTIPLIGWIFPRKIVHVIGRLLGNEYLLSHLYGFGYLAMVVAGIIFIRTKKYVLNKEFHIAMFMVMLFCVWFQTKLFPYDAVKSIIGIMQFPWRVIIVGTFSLAILTAVLYSAESDKFKKLTSVILLVTLYCGSLAMVSSAGWNLALMAFSEGYQETMYEFDSFDVGQAEYLPEQLYIYDEENRYAYRDFIKERRNSVLSDNDAITATCVKEENKTIVRYANNDGNSNLELPLIMYKGYYAQDILSGDEIPIQMSEHGLVRIMVSDPSGEVAVWYKGTAIQILSIVISGITILVMILFVALDRKRNKVVEK